MQSLEHTRSIIATKVRELRQGRGMTQEELARRLGLSQSRLSEIERGAGSFSAEQFIAILRLFNVSTSHFVKSPDSHDALQNALARGGAEHLQESEGPVPTARHDDLHEVVREALLDGSSRLIASIAPILLRNARKLNLHRFHAEMAQLGYERRFVWVVENTLDALKKVMERANVQLRRDLLNADVILHAYLEFATLRVKPGDQPEDILDPSIRTTKTLKEVRNHRSAASSRWGIVTAIQPSDFETAIRTAYGLD